MMKSKNLAMAYAVKRKTSKMANGGKVDSDMDHGSKRGPQGHSKYQEQAQNEKGVHTPVSGVTQFPGGKGTSAAGDLTKDRYDGKAILNDEAKKKHIEKLAEMKAMPKPKLQGLAEGGIVKHPSTPFTTKSTKMLKDEEEQRARMPIETEEMGESEEDDEQVNPPGLESDDDEMSPAKGAFMAGKMMAEGGEAEDEGMDEEELEHHASIASAIMARTEKKKMMAEGGRVDLDSNEEEHPESYTHDDEEALKENYDASTDSQHTPDTDDEHGHKIEDEDSHDMISRIMARMKTKSPMVK